MFSAACTLGVVSHQVGAALSWRSKRVSVAVQESCPGDPQWLSWLRSDDLSFGSDRQVLVVGTSVS